LQHELVLAKWYKTHGAHKALLALADEVLHTRKNETEDLADFLHRADGRNPFAIAVSHDTPLSALIPLKTQALPAVSVSLGGVVADPAGMQAAKVQVGVKDNVLAAAAHQSAVRDGYETAAARYQVCALLDHGHFFSFPSFLPSVFASVVSKCQGLHLL
jgi:hypothetical protein